MVDGRNIFDQPVINDIIPHEKILKIATGHGDDYTRGCLLSYLYFKEKHKMVAIDLSKQQAPDSDPKSMQKNVDQAGKTTILDFSRGTVRLL